MADIAKTTGLVGVELDKLGQDILQIYQTTRTSIPDLQKIGEIGGQLGIATVGLKAFIIEGNKFSVALGGDFGGVENAVTQVSKLKTLFKDTKNITIDEAIKRIGSSINELGAVGAATSQNITDFSLRLGSLPEAFRPTATTAAALGAYFEEIGLNSEIASSGLTNLFIEAGRNLGGFASQMNISKDAANELFKTDPSKFAVKFANSLKGLRPDQLALKLKQFSLNSNEVLKVIGGLNTDTARYNQLLAISNDAFAKGTSLQEEYNKKNNDTAGKLAQVKNISEALSITLGQQLLPIVNDFIIFITPVINKIGKWAQEHKAITKFILLTAGAVGFLLAAISLVSFAVAGLTKLTVLWEASIWLANFAQGALAVTTGTVTGEILANAAATKGVMLATRLATAAQWAWNAALLANPIGLLIAAIAAMAIGVYVAIKNWETFGAALTLALGGIGLIVRLVMTFRDNWEMLSNSFKNGSMIDGLKAIGKVLLDVILLPFQQILNLIAQFTGFDWAKSAAVSLRDFRADLGVNINDNDKQLINPKVADAERTAATSNQKVVVEVVHKDQYGRVMQDQQFNTPVTTSTSNYTRP